MNVLSYRSNLIFLIWIRNKHILFLLNHKLNKPLYYLKLINALTTKESAINYNGTSFIIWRLNDKIHRDEGPAVINGISTENPNGTYHAYFRNGKLHRDFDSANIEEISVNNKNGPAIIYGISKNNPNGNIQSYYTNGKLFKNLY